MTASLLGCAVVGVPVVGGLALVGATGQTARRPRTGDARQRVLGAWHDVLDPLVENGPERPSSRTVEEHVERAERESASLTGLLVVDIETGAVETPIELTGGPGRLEIVVTGDPVYIGRFPARHRNEPRRNASTSCPA